MVRFSKTEKAIAILCGVTILYFMGQLYRAAFFYDPGTKQGSVRSEILTPLRISASTTTSLLTPETTIPRVTRGSPRTHIGKIPGEKNDDFWKRLSNCESFDGRSGSFIGFFQFSRDTAAKVGIDGSESYDIQRDAAKVWAAKIHPNEGGRSGWPRCWWVAFRT